MLASQKQVKVGAFRLEWSQIARDLEVLRSLKEERGNGRQDGAIQAQDGQSKEELSNHFQRKAKSWEKFRQSCDPTSPLGARKLKFG